MGGSKTRIEIELGQGPPWFASLHTNDPGTSKDWTWMWFELLVHLVTTHDLWSSKRLRQDVKYGILCCVCWFELHEGLYSEYVSVKASIFTSYDQRYACRSFSQSNRDNTKRMST